MREKRAEKSGTKEELIERIIKAQRNSSPKKTSKKAPTKKKAPAKNTTKKAPAKKKASAPREFTRRGYIDRIESLYKRKGKALPSGLKYMSLDELEAEWEHIYADRRNRKRKLNKNIKSR